MRHIIEAIRRRSNPVDAGRAGAGLLLAAVVALAACEGDNLFGGDDSGTVAAPEIVELTAPESVNSGDRFDVRVRATSERKVANIEVKLRSAMQLDTVEFVTPPRADVTVDFSFQVPLEVRDTLLIVNVTATDQAGSKSEITADTVKVRDVTAPTASVTLEPSEASAGDTVWIRIDGEDNVALDALGYLILGAEGDTLSLELAQVAGSKTDSLTLPYVVPDSMPPTTLTVLGQARDITGLNAEEPGAAALRILDRRPPVVTIVRPGAEATYPIGDSILVEVRVTDNGGLRSANLIGLSFRGDAELGTDTTVLRYQGKSVTLRDAEADTLLPAVRDTVLKRYLIPTEDKTSEFVSMIVNATDVSGNTGTDTVEVSIGGPRVEIQSPSSGQAVQSGRTVGVRVFATDPSDVSIVQLMYTGVVADTIDLCCAIPMDTVVLDTAIALPSGQSGVLELAVTAFNTNGIRGRAEPVLLEVQNNVLPDLTQPTVSFAISNRSRMELGDSVRVTVTARDNDGGSGLTRMGFTALAVNTARTDTLTRSAVVTYPTPRSGDAVRTFSFAPFNVDSLTLPDTLSFYIHAFAVDSAGNCAAAGTGAEQQQLGCVTFKGDTVAANALGERVDAVVVAGRTIMLPDGGLIGDAAVEMDTANAQFRLFLSNLKSSRVDVLNLADSTFGSPIRVGSQPLGLFVDPSLDTLFVATSGGVYIPMVQLGATPVELTSERVLTPEAVLYEIEYSEDDIGRIKYTVDFHGFSDRPQFIAKDSIGRLVYSTQPTGFAPDGTVRVVDRDPVPTTTADLPEIRILFDPSEAVDAVENFIAVANIDSIIVQSDPAGNDLLVFYDHKPGFPDSTVSAGMDEGLALWEALDSLVARSGDTKIIQKPGKWVLEKVGMSDTTYIAAAGDRGKVVFGEGATSPTGRVMLWEASRADVSHEVSIADLMQNASDVVRGVGLNRNGTLGVMRGAAAAYFFNEDLRQLGMYVPSDGALGDAGAGAALHWANDNPLATGESATAFIASSRQTIKVVNSTYYDEINEIHIRDNIVGPLRVTSPLPSDNGGLGASCVGQDCVVAKLYGVTAAGGVLVLDILRRDINP